MGITGLLPFLKEIIEDTHIQTYAGKRVAIDTYCWIHKGAFACASDLAKGTKTKVYVNYCLKFINMLKSYKVIPVLVFDGCNIPSKQEVEHTRRENRQLNLLKGKKFLSEGNMSKARDCFVKSVNVTSEMALSVMQAARSMGVDCIVAPYEADAQLAYLIKSKLVDAIITEDSDLLCFGCETVLYKLDLTGRCQKVEQKNISKVSCIKGFTLDEFRQACILSGCDYLKNIRGVGLKKAVKAIKLSKGKNISLVVKRLNQYIPKIGIVNAAYPIQFNKANKTFLYQLVFDPVARKLVPINPYPEGLTVKDLEFAGPEFSNELAFQIALGNIEVFRKQRIDNFDVDNWLKNSPLHLQCTSIWKKANAPKLKEVHNKNAGCAFDISGSKDMNRKTTFTSNKNHKKDLLSTADALNLLFKNKVNSSNNSSNTVNLSQSNTDAKVLLETVNGKDLKAFKSSSSYQTERLSQNNSLSPYCNKNCKKSQNKKDTKTVRSRFFQSFSSIKDNHPTSNINLIGKKNDKIHKNNEQIKVSAVIETNNLLPNIKRKIVSSSTNKDEVEFKRQRLKLDRNITPEKNNSSLHKQSNKSLNYCVEKDQHNVFNFFENSTPDYGLEVLNTSSESTFTSQEMENYNCKNKQTLDSTDNIGKNNNANRDKINSQNKGKNPFCKKISNKPKNSNILNLYDKSKELKFDSVNAQEGTKKQIFKSKYFGPARASGLKKKRKPFQATIKRFFEKV